MLGKRKKKQTKCVVSTTLALLKNKFYRFQVQVSPTALLLTIILIEERKHMPTFSLILFYAHIIPCFQSLTAFVF